MSAVFEDRPHWEVFDLMNATDGELIDVWNGKPFDRFTPDEWRECFMFHGGRIITDEQEMFDELPEPFTIWRGGRTEESARDGFAWSTSEEVAQNFAQFFNPPPPYGGSFMAPILGGGWLARARVTKENVAMFTNARKEYEVVLHPLAVLKDVTVEKIAEHPHAVEFYGDRYPGAAS